MKRTLLAAALLLLGAFAFSQESPKIAVFPFEDLDNIFSGNESLMFYRRFSNEFVNRNADRFTIVPRQDVERLINTEAKFQLTEFSAREKTAEMERVLNGTRILSGIIARAGNKLTISVSLYNYPTLSQLPGGFDLDVANKDELTAKVPELVQMMMNAIVSNLPKPPPSESPKPKRTWTTNGTIFEDYSIFNALVIFGYNYSPDVPLGFSLGFFGVYTSFGFALPNWGDNKRYGINDNHSWRETAPDYYTYPYTDQKYEIIDWVLGYNITIIPRILYLPVGVGIETVKGWRLQYLLYDDGSHGIIRVWCPAPQWETNVLFEAGLLLRPTNKFEFTDTLTFCPYIYGTYRFIMSDKHTFSIGGGISFEKTRG